MSPAQLPVGSARDAGVFELEGVRPFAQEPIEPLRQRFDRPAAVLERAGRPELRADRRAAIAPVATISGFLARMR